MRLGVKWLKNVSGVNTFEYGSEPSFYQNDNQTIYFQIVDEDTGSMSSVATPFWASFGVPSGGQQVLGAARRYMPSSGATLQMTLDSVDSEHQIVRFVSQPFPGDGSIWRLDLTPTDPVNGTVDAIIVLTETGGVRHSARISGALRIQTMARF